MFAAFCFFGNLWRQICYICHIIPSSSFSLSLFIIVAPSNNETRIRNQIIVSSSALPASKRPESSRIFLFRSLDVCLFVSFSLLFLIKMILKKRETYSVAIRRRPPRIQSERKKQCERQSLRMDDCCQIMQVACLVFIGFERSWFDSIQAQLPYLMILTRRRI